MLQQLPTEAVKDLSHPFGGGTLVKVQEGKFYENGNQGRMLR